MGQRLGTCHWQAYCIALLHQQDKHTVHYMQRQAWHQVSDTNTRVTKTCDLKMNVRLKVNESERSQLTRSTSFFNSSMSLSFFMALAFFFLPPCSEVAASSYCSRPSYRGQEEIVRRDKEKKYIYKHNKIGRKRPFRALPEKIKSSPNSSKSPWCRICL